MEEQRATDTTMAQPLVAASSLPTGQTAAASMNQLGTSGSSAASALAVAAAAAAPYAGSANQRRFFIELDASAAATSTKQELQVTQLPSDWLTSAPPAELICCICTDVAWQTPNLLCGQSKRKRTPAQPTAQPELTTRSFFVVCF
jgi:hypothetical protein